MARDIGKISAERLKSAFGVPKSGSEEQLRKAISDSMKSVCKPCWELRYCPYGPLVEQFPLPRMERKDVVRHNEFLRKQFKAKAYDANPNRASLKRQLTDFKPSSFPIVTSKEEKFVGCNIFGHVCPVFIVREGFTETTKGRNITRNIPFQVRLRVVRRDNYTCQRCGKHLKENELEFDHKIPYALGGPTEENNIELTCHTCNRKKGKKVSI